jgi:3-oxoacyl-[acyl-carrier-protein] synthase I
MGGGPAFLSDLGIVSSLGRGKQAVLRNLMAMSRAGVCKRNDLLSDGATAYVGAVTGDLPALPAELAAYDCRNAGLLVAALEQMRESIERAVGRYGRDRIAVVLGTSTSGLAEGEVAFAEARRTGAFPPSFDIRRQELGSPAEIAARYLQLEGPAFTVSTACSSSAQALADARRLLRCGMADAVLAGGVDSLCRLTLNGFRALSALSPGLCNPFSRNRDGTMIGEGAAVFLMEREDSEIALLGTGASCDAHSMTAPGPEATGVIQAMRDALDEAGIEPAAIDFIELHGTGTEQNDAMESKAILTVFGEGTPCSSSKGRVGHTLGAAGAMGAAHCWLTASSLNDAGTLPPHVWDGAPAEGLLDRSLVQAGQALSSSAKRVMLCNALAFGGNNLSLVIGRSVQ